MENEERRKKKVKDKVTFYFKEQLKAHVLIMPEGFKNGVFLSDLEHNTFYWFIDDREQKIRIFLSEIYDIEDYKGGDGYEQDEWKTLLNKI